MPPIFNTSWEYPRISCLVQIWWFSLKNVKFMDNNQFPNQQGAFNYGVLHLLSKFSGSSFNWGWFMKMGQTFNVLSSNWPWKSRSTPPPPPLQKTKKQTKKNNNNRDLNQVVLHLWSKLGDHSLNSLVQNQTLVTVWRRLPKLVANISSEFHHLVNTELAVGSLVKWLPIKVAHPCKSDTIWVVYCSPIANGSVQL